MDNHTERRSFLNSKEMKIMIEKHRDQMFREDMEKRRKLKKLIGARK